MSAIISTVALRDFLAARGITEHVEAEQTVMPPMPNAVVLLRQTGGPGTSRELVFNRTSMQVRCRGEQANRASAEDLANRVDAALMNAPLPTTIGGKAVVRIDYVGGPPSWLGQEETGARRTEYVATYLLEIAR